MSKLIQIENNLIEHKDIDIDISEIRKTAFDFYTCCVLKKEKPYENIRKLIKARRQFELCLTLVKSIISPRSNEFIEKVNSQLHSYDVFLNNLDVSLALLDKEMEEFNRVENTSRIMANPVYPVKIENFKQRLLDYMSTMVVFPFVNSFEYFVLNKEIIKNRENYVYQLFREVYNSVEIKGSPTRQKLALSGSMASFTEYNKNIIRTGKKQPEQFIDITPPENPIKFENPFEDEENELS